MTIPYPFSCNVFIIWRLTSNHIGINHSAVCTMRSALCSFFLNRLSLDIFVKLLLGLKNCSHSRINSHQKVICPQMCSVGKVRRARDELCQTTDWFENIIKTHLEFERTLNVESMKQTTSQISVHVFPMCSLTSNRCLRFEQKQWKWTNIKTKSFVLNLQQELYRNIEVTHCVPYHQFLTFVI